MASYLKPRRGALSAISSTKLLAGEIFFETTNGVGGGKGRLMMGDGSNTYNNLKSSSKYFLDVDSTPVSFSSLSTSDSAITDLRTLGNSIKSDSTTQGTLPHLIRVLQRSLANIEGRLTKLNNDKIDNTISKDISSTITNVSFRKQGNIVSVICTNITASTLISKTIPQEYRPSENQIWFDAFMITNNNTYSSIISFKNNGSIEGSFYNPGGEQNQFTSAYTSHMIYFVTSYIVN